MSKYHQHSCKPSPAQAGCEGVSVQEGMNDSVSESGACLPRPLVHSMLPQDKRKEDFCLVSASCVPGVGTRMLQTSRLMLVTSQEGDLCPPMFLMRDVRFADLDEPAWSGHQAGAPSSPPFSLGVKGTEALPPPSSTHPC